MLLIFMGASCTGKSSAAEMIRKDMNIQVFTGKDYLRLHKNESEARNKFDEMLNKASLSSGWADDSLIYIVTETAELQKLKPAEHALFVLFTADPSLIKERFAGRMKGNLPKPLEMMLEKQMKNWEDVRSDLSFETTDTKTDEIKEKIISYCENRTVISQT